MRVLLTGSAGFIGTAIGAALDEAGHEVVRIDAMLPQAHGAGVGAGVRVAELPDDAGHSDLPIPRAVAGLTDTPDPPPEHLFDDGLVSLHRHDSNGVLHRSRRR